MLPDAVYEKHADHVRRERDLPIREEKIRANGNQRACATALACSARSFRVAPQKLFYGFR
jgi:hypothetical protein